MEPAGHQGPIAFTSLASGAYSGLRQPGAYLVTDAQTWQRIWDSHTSTQVPAPPPPEVDFRKESLVVVALGERNTGGYSIQVSHVAVQDGRLVIDVAVRQPGPGDMVTMAFTQPFHMVRIPRVGELEVQVNGLPAAPTDPSKSSM